MTVRQTACRHCGTDIEGLSPYRAGEWHDRSGNTTCRAMVWLRGVLIPTDSLTHAPMRQRDLWSPTERCAKGTRAGQRFAGSL